MNEFSSRQMKDLGKAFCSNLEYTCNTDFKHKLKNAAAPTLKFKKSSTQAEFFKF